MATTNYIKQPCNVGVHRGLRVQEREHVVCLLRVIERLPLLCEAGSEDPEQIRQQFEFLRRNLLDIAEVARQFLTPEGEG